MSQNVSGNPNPVVIVTFYSWDRLAVVRAAAQRAVRAYGPALDWLALR